MKRPALLVAGLALALACIQLCFALVHAIFALILSLPVGVLFALPTLRDAAPVAVLTVGLYYAGRLSYRLLDRSGVFPDVEAA